MFGEIGYGMGRIIKPGLSAELIYSFAIIACCLIIYFGTREIYELSAHKGIWYFRQAFLFFAFAYFFRSFIKIIIFYFNAYGLFQIPPRLLNPIVTEITLIFFMYFGSMAVFYLLYSVLWKKFNDKMIYLFHLIAIFIALFGVLSKNPYSYIVLNLILFLFIVFVVVISYLDQRKKKKKKSFNLYTIYVLLLFFWILNIIDILIPFFLSTFQVFIYMISLSIFFIMQYKVLKRVGN